MATISPEGKPKKAPRIQRFAIGVNVVIQILLILFILAGINYVSFKHFKRWDFSRDQKFALSDETKRCLATLQSPVKILVCFEPDFHLTPEVYQDVEALLKEYQYAADGKVEVEMVNQVKDLNRAKEVMAQYKFGTENVVVVDYQGHSKILNVADMADIDDSGADTGAPPSLKAFKGEQVLTGAILEVSEPTQNKIYLVGGKGGPELEGEELSAFKTYLERQNLKLDSVTLMNLGKIPDDAKVLMLIGPKYDVTDRELSLLRDYWDKQGRLFIALDPAGTTPKLAAFLREAGITPQDDRVLRLVPMGPVSVIDRDVAGIFSDTSTVTNRLKGVETVFSGQTQSLALGQPQGIHTEALITAAQGYWGETKYQDMANTGVSYDPKEDISAPLNVAASVEKGALADQSVKMDTSRMIVTGNETFLTNEALTQANIDFVVAGINWLLNREELIGIPPKEEQPFVFNIADQDFVHIELLVMTVIPCAIIVFGGIVWARRRR
jgi:hypothetical protein